MDDDKANNICQLQRRFTAGYEKDDTFVAFAHCVEDHKSNDICPTNESIHWYTLLITTQWQQLSRYLMKQYGPWTDVKVSINVLGGFSMQPLGPLIACPVSSERRTTCDGKFSP